MKIFPLLLCLLGILSCKKNPPTILSSSGGRIHLESHDFSSKPIIKLSQNWRYFPNSLLLLENSGVKTPGVLRECELPTVQSSCMEQSLSSVGMKILQDPDAGIPVTLPHIWLNDEKNPRGDGTGYAVYSLPLSMKAGRFGLFCKNWLLNSAGRIWVFQKGRLILIDSIGYPGVSEEKSREEALGILAIHEFEEGDATLLIEVSNYQYRTGYLSDELYFAKEYIARGETLQYFIKESIVFGILFLSGLYHIVLFLLRKKIKYALLFGIFSLLMSMRVFIVARIFQIFYPDTDTYVWMNRFEYLLFIIPPVVFLTYFKFLFRDRESSIYFKIILSITLLCSSLVIFTDSRTFSNFFTLLQIPMVISIIYGYINIFPKLSSGDLNQKFSSRILIGVFIFYSLTLIHDLLMYQFQWNDLEYSGLGLVVFIMGQSIVIAKINADALETSEKLTAHLEKEVEIRTRQYREEYKKSESLLLNILPSKVADELKTSGKTEPEYFESVSVCFTDFVGFTKIAESLKPSELVSELDDCFSFFDYIIEKYKLEKLKTIGDSYMFAGGLPIRSRTHAIDCILASLEIQSFMDNKKFHKISEGKPYWELRLGINSGSLVAGVIGNKKFAYDIWSDTVNTASRCESSGVPGKINISKSTYEMVSVFFDCEYRGAISAKNKGELDMYIVTGIKKHLAIEGLPGPEFWKLYDETGNGGQG